jgi:hypothetical protein
MGRERGLLGGVGEGITGTASPPGTGNACGAVEGCATSAAFCASATSSAVLKAEVGVGGARGLLGASDSARSCTVGTDDSLGGETGGGTWR